MKCMASLQLVFFFFFLVLLKHKSTHKRKRGLISSIHHILHIRCDCCCCCWYCSLFARTFIPKYVAPTKAHTVSHMKQLFCFFYCCCYCCCWLFFFIYYYFWTAKQYIYVCVSNTITNVRLALSLQYWIHSRNNSWRHSRLNVFASFRVRYYLVQCFIDFFSLALAVAAATILRQLLLLLLLLLTCLLHHSILPLHLPCISVSVSFSFSFDSNVFLVLLCFQKQFSRSNSIFHIMLKSTHLFRSMCFTLSSICSIHRVVGISCYCYATD